MAFFAPQTNAKYFNAKSPKIVSIVGFLPAFSLAPSGANDPTSFHFNWDGNFLRTKRIPRNQKGTQRRTSPIRRGSPEEDVAGESTTPAMGKWLLWCFGNMRKQLRWAERGGTRNEKFDVDRKSLWHFSLAFFAQCALSVCLSDFSSIRMSQRAANVRRYFFGCPLKEPRREEPSTIERQLKLISRR